MKGSLKIARVSGIDVFVHPTFLILVGWIALSYWLVNRSVMAVVEGVGFILALFGCVVLHELGHALAARRYGIRTADITLLPIGGVARLERMPDKPWQEFVVALAGPLVNVAIAAALAIGLWLGGAQFQADGLSMTEGSFVVKLMLVNVALVVFNLMPAFPMDGGRILRAFLATQMSYTRATGIAAAVGQGLALVFGFLGLFSNPFLVFIALFVWIGAAQEASTAQIKSAITGIPVRDAMVTAFRSLPPHAELSDAVAITLQGSQKDFPIMRSGEVIGVLTQANLLKAISERGPKAFAGEFMQPCKLTLDANEMLDQALQRIEDDGFSLVPVVENHRLVGLLTMENIGEYLRIQAALSNRQVHPHRKPQIPKGKINGEYEHVAGNPL